jgi:hypothetical protein
MDQSIDPHEYLRDVLTRITETTSWQVARPHPGKVGGKEALAEKGGVDAVRVVAFAYDTYSKPSKNKGVLRATLTKIHRSPQSHRPDPLDVQTDWRWQKLKITLDPKGRMTAAYGKLRQSYTFTNANKTGICRRIEILATMAVHGAWQPSRIHSEADKKAFTRLQAELHGRVLKLVSWSPNVSAGPRNMSQ